MASTYDVGDVITVTGEFTDTGGTPGDPTTVNFLYDSPTSTAPTTATRPGATTGEVDGITRVSSGVYQYDVTATGAGLYETRFSSTGSLQASGEGWFSVRPRYVST